MKSFKKYLMSGSVVSAVLLAMLTMPVQAKTVWLEADDYRLAEGDAEEVPAEIISEPIAVEKTPTITAEGEFILPTYVMPDAQPAVKSSVAVTDNANPFRVEEKAVVTAVAASSPDGQIPVVKNIEQQYQDTTSLLKQTSDRLAALEQNVKNLQKQTVSVATGDALKPVVTEPKKPLLLPLAPVAKPIALEKTETAPEPTVAPRQTYIDYVISVIERAENTPESFSASDESVLNGLPKEMKISFLPKSADISEQSFKWIKVFAYHAKKSVQNAVEIRLSSYDLDLQSRRFALIKGVLLANGLAPRQIRFVLTDRNPESVVLRGIVLPPEEEIFYEKAKNGKINSQIVQKW